MRNLVYFVSTPLLKRDLKIYDVDFFNKNNIQVCFFNLWPLFSKGLEHKTDVDYKYQIHIDSISCLIAELKKFDKKNTTFISDFSFSLKRISFYFVLTYLRIEYSFVDNWYAIIPSKKHTNSFSGKLKQKLPTGYDLLRFVFTVFLKKPKYVFWPTKNSFHCKVVTGSNSKIIPYASLNHDDYIQFTKNYVNTNLVTEDYFVFVDQYLTDLPDFARMGVKSPLTEKYYDSLNKQFQELSNNANLEYVVANHPRRIDSDKVVFKTEHVFYYLTFELIKNSKFVFIHNSMSVYWAVLLKKPIVFIITEEIKDTFIEDKIKMYANELKQEVINIDEIALRLDSLALEINEEVYEQFRLKHIVYDTICDLKSYEIVYQTIYN